MREIKFRAWDGAKMLTAHQIGFVTPVISNATESMATAIALLQKRYALMQFTGLHDERQKEIYENDVLTDHSICDDAGSQTRLRVGFSGGAFRVLQTNCKCGCLGTVLNPSDMEIIGNSYENPELL